MRFCTKLFMLSACLIPIHGTFASCGQYGYLPNGYQVSGNAAGYGSGTTVYLCDSDTKYCQKVQQGGVGCQKGTTTVQHYFGSCSMNVTTCTLSDCTYTTSRPSGESTAPTYGYDCATTATKYVVSADAHGPFLQVTECTACKSGYFLSDSMNLQFYGCPFTFRTCTRCPAGTRRVSNTSTVCVECTRGTYSKGGASLSCTSCPRVTNVYFDKNLNANASSAITSDVGAESASECYLSGGTTYYDATGAFSYPDIKGCRQDGAPQK